jgi:mannose-6-phosphate isomerase
MLNGTVELARCKYFTTNLLDLDKPMMRNMAQLDSFIVYICMEGSATIVDDKWNRLHVHQGQTVLIPADTEIIVIAPTPRAKFMEVYIDW